jgi:LysR substrate binding domain
LGRQRGGIGKTRHEQDRQAGSANSDASGNFDPVHPGHDEIHDHQINPIAFLAKTVERLSPVCRFNDVVASITKHAGRGCSLAFRDTPAGLLRLTVLPPAASFMLAPLLSRFLAQYPAIDLEISVDAVLTDIVAGRFDAGMRAGDRIERDMIAVRIGRR